MSHRNSNGDSSGRPQQQKKKKPKGYASLLHAVDVRCIVLDRVRENGPERVSLRGRQLADPDAVKAVCDAVMELRVGVDEQASSSIDSKTKASKSPCTTLNLASGNVCSIGAAHLANFLLDPRCQLKELNLVDNPKLGVYLSEFADTPPAHTVDFPEGTEKVKDGRGCEILAKALRSNKCTLTQLNLGGCGITCAGASALARALRGDTRIDRGDTSADRQTEGAVDKSDTSVDRKQRVGSPNLEHLNLRSNDIGYAGVTELAGASETHGVVREISLGNNAHVSELARRELHDVLSVNRRKALLLELATASKSYDKKISLRRRRLSDEDARTIASAIVPGACADEIQSLDLSENDLTSFGLENLAHAVRGINGNQSLCAVSVVGNPGAHFDGEGKNNKNASESSKGVSNFKTDSTAKKAVRFTDAARKLLGAVAANYIQNAGTGEALKSIADRGLGDVGAIEVANVIAATVDFARDDRSWAFQLQSIGTQHNEIRGDGCAALANAIGRLPNLIEWACYANPVGHGGAQAIAWAISTPGQFLKLTVLDVGGSDIGDVGCVAISESIVGHRSLHELHLDHNGIGKSGALALLGSMERTLDGNKGSSNHFGLRRVWLHGNPDVPDLVMGRVHEISGANSAKDDVSGSINSGFEDSSALESTETINACDFEIFSRSEKQARKVYEAAKHVMDVNRVVDTSALFADRVAANAVQTYRHRCPSHLNATRGNAVVAAIVAHTVGRGGEIDTPGNGDELRTIALGIGTKFMPPPVAAAAAAGGVDRYAKVVHDSHAEVLARRALLRFLNREMRELTEEYTSHSNKGWPMAAPDSSGVGNQSTERFRLLELNGDGSGFSVKGNVSLHLYVSTAPCGAASVPKEARFDEGKNSNQPKSSNQFDPRSFVTSMLPPAPRGVTSDPKYRPKDVIEYDLDDVAVYDTFKGVDERHERGVYAYGSTKNSRAMRKGAMDFQSQQSAPAPGCVLLRSLNEAFGTPGATLSCSDKITRWQILGAQGAALSCLIKNPITFNSIVVGRKFDGDALRLGTCCRTYGFPHEVFRLPKPKHCAALHTNVTIETSGGGGRVDGNDDSNYDSNASSRKNKKIKNRSTFIADKARADAGDSDESITWCYGEGGVTRHDGRTGMTVGGGGPVPVVARAWQFRDLQNTLGTIKGKREVFDVLDSDKIFTLKSAEDAKAAAVTYAAGKHALLKGKVAPTSALAGWRGQ